jgi:hypothetical protein
LPGAACVWIFEWTTSTVAAVLVKRVIVTSRSLNVPPAKSITTRAYAG